MTPSDLKAFRADMTQVEFAESLGVNQSQISRWERGVQPIPAWVGKMVECLENVRRKYA